MTAAILSKAPRQSTILAAVAALHVGVFLVVAGDRIEIALPPAAPTIFDIIPPAPEPTSRPAPEPTTPATFDPGPLERPDVLIPDFPDVPPAVDPPDGVPASAMSGAGPRAEDYQPPSIAMRGDRLAALIATCYPPAARRLEEEGRAHVRIVVSAGGRASSWALAESTGIPRLDSALNCVVRRLQFEPGRRNGRAVDAQVQLPIVFRLS